MKRLAITVLSAFVVTGCSTPEPPPAVSEPVVPAVDPKLETHIRACVVGIVDDMGLLGTKYPELVNFKPEVIKGVRSMQRNRPNVINAEGKPSAFPPLGFSYSYNVVIAPGRPPVFTTDGCLIRVNFYAIDPGLKVDNLTFFRGHGVQGIWCCAGSNPDALKADLGKILEKHAKALEKNLE